eukprot:scaffold5504_cov101-Isochrysis_galbana.AAC.2
MGTERRVEKRNAVVHDGLETLHLGEHVHVGRRPALATRGARVAPARVQAVGRALRLVEGVGQPDGQLRVQGDHQLWHGAAARRQGRRLALSQEGGQHVRGADLELGTK